MRKFELLSLFGSGATSISALFILYKIEIADSNTATQTASRRVWSPDIYSLEGFSPESSSYLKFASIFAL